MIRRILYFCLPLSLMVVGGRVARGQTDDAIEATLLEAKADSLYRTYNFARAKSLYKNLISMESSPTIRSEMEIKSIACDNGEAMLQFIAEPKIINRKSLSIKDFYLYYPGISLLEAPVTEKEGMDTLYYPLNATTIYFSAPGKNGDKDLFSITLGADGVWSEPFPLGANVNSSGDEIYPFISNNGKQLYFTSNGHYGVGGYDLYVSEWDDSRKTWGIAQNLGIPYSSPADDYFFYITPDNKYEVFSSTRDFTESDNEDNIVSYIALHQPDTETLSATAEEARAVAELKVNISSPPTQAQKVVEKPTQSVDSQDSVALAIRENYSRINIQYKVLQNRSDSLSKSLEDAREDYSALLRGGVSSDTLSALANTITEMEQQLLNIQTEMHNTSIRIRQIELNFLSSGTVVPPDDETLSENSQKEENYSEDFRILEFPIDKAVPTPAEEMLFTYPEPKNVTDFKILKSAVIAELSSFPNGIVYQIQIATTSAKTSIVSLKGLAPVYERRSGGKYLYYAGIFYTYAEAQKALPSVKKLGFSSAFIVAFKDGKVIKIEQARAAEGKGIAPSTPSTHTPATNSRTKTSASYNVVISGYSGSLPPEILSLLRSTGKDIAKSSSQDGFKYIVGPFSSEASANELATKLRALSDKSISVE